MFFISLEALFGMFSLTNNSEILYTEGINYNKTIKGFIKVGAFQTIILGTGIVLAQEQMKDYFSENSWVLILCMVVVYANINNILKALFIFYQIQQKHSLVVKYKNLQLIINLVILSVLLAFVNLSPIIAFYLTRSFSCLVIFLFILPKKILKEEKGNTWSLIRWIFNKSKYLLINSLTGWIFGVGMISVARIIETSNSEQIILAYSLSIFGIFQILSLAINQKYLADLKNSTSDLINTVLKKYIFFYILAILATSVTLLIIFNSTVSDLIFNNTIKNIDRDVIIQSIFMSILIFAVSIPNWISSPLYLIFNKTKMFFNTTLLGNILGLMTITILYNSIEIKLISLIILSKLILGITIASNSKKLLL